MIMPPKVPATIEEQMLVLSLALNELQTKVNKHHTLLIEGNGEKPIPERLRNVEKFTEEIRYWTKYVFGALIIQTIAFGVGIVIAIVRFLPILEKLSQP